MATGHILPGYNDPVTRLRRIQSAGYQLDNRKLMQMESQYKLGESEFDRIRAQARNIWSRQDRERTTYQFFHSGHDLPGEEKAVSRPASPDRRNKPHPQQVFLTNRLHYIEGYHNPDTTLGKPCYRIDASLPPEQQQQRRHIRRKYVADRPASTLLNTFKDQYGVRGFLEPEDAQAAEAWLKIADDKDKEHVMEALQHQREQNILNQPQQTPVPDLPRAQTAYPSLTRYMKFAGANESGAMSNLIRPFNSMTGYQAQMRSNDLEATRKIRTMPFRGRGEFLLHPDWPPTLPHHRVP